MMLKVSDLHVSINNEPILKGINLEIPAGEIHAIMGPNGSGKSTLSKVIAGHPAYQVTQGSILFKDQDLLTLSADERARSGIFMSFQYPVEIPGVTNIHFLKSAMNAVRLHQKKPVLDAMEFLDFVRKTSESLDMDESFLYRSINEGFSGGEKKCNEILQMKLLEPSLALLDETDSGLDIDALRIVAEGVNTMRSPERSMIIVTHYQRLLDYVEPDVIHVLSEGQIIRTGDKSLAKELEAKGYSWLTGE